MDLVFRGFDRACLGLIRLLVRFAVAVDDIRRRVPRRLRRWRGSPRRLYRTWLRRHRLGTPPPAACARRGRPSWNRTPEHLEQKLVRLHVEQPLLGAGQLRFLAERVLGFRPGRETVRRILARRRDLVVAMEDERRRRPRRIRVSGPRRLWGADLTILWVLGFIPVWVLGVVDYHGSRLVAFERLSLWPTAAEVTRVLATAISEAGAPQRLLTDRAPVFTAGRVRDLLGRHAVRHVRIRPAHPWTGGRIERVFLTFKSTQPGLAPP